MERILNDGTLDDYRELVSTLGGRGIVGNAIPADAPTRSLSKRCNAGTVTRLVGNASKRCNTGAVTLGSVTYYEAARTTAGGRGGVTDFFSGKEIQTPPPTPPLERLRVGELRSGMGRGAAGA